MVSAFVSYSWDSDAHKEWVRALAARLRGDGIDVTLDQWHLVPGDQLPEFMERSVRERDYVLIVCTPRFKERSDWRAGGVGYEGDIITGAVLTDRNQRKFIPLLRLGAWETAAPTWLAGKYHLDFRGEPYSEGSYQDLSTTLLGTRLQAPPVGGRPLAAPSSQPTAPPRPPAGASTAFEPVRITGVIVDEIGAPRGDGTPGSALYRVPFRFSRRSPSEWARLFVEAFNHPSSYTSMHRPGIASVNGERVVLDGTTVEEVERYHRATLVLATQEANERYLEILRGRRDQEEREQQRLEQHKQVVADAAKRIRFD
jgi:hypothetical protein